MSRRRAEAIVRRLGVRAGETVLVYGGAGGVGSFAVRIAKAAGARVLATAGPDNLKTLTRLGANVAVDTRVRAQPRSPSSAPGTPARMPSSTALAARRW